MHSRRLTSAAVVSPQTSRQSVQSHCELIAWPRAQVEDLLEYYMQRAATTQSEAERLLAGARDLEESIGVSLSARRFEVRCGDHTVTCAQLKPFGKVQQLTTPACGSATWLSLLSEACISSRVWVALARRGQLDCRRHAPASCCCLSSTLAGLPHICRHTKRAASIAQVNRLELTLSIGSFAAALGAVVAGIFGMNLRSTCEESVIGFWGCTAAIIFGCIWVFAAIYKYMRQRRIL